MVIVDTEFLFGLRKEDKNYLNCREILDKSSKNLEIPGIALLELILVMMSQKKDYKQIHGYLETIAELVNMYDLKEVKLGLHELLFGIKALEEDPSLTFFDGLIIGTAKANQRDILGNDESYQERKDIRGWTFKNYLKKLR